ncbi:MAG: hypothetical protein ABSD03_15830 [Vulcanimicrobiaceae bacterium]|jgi:hypothetical protein
MDRYAFVAVELHDDLDVDSAARLPQTVDSIVARHDRGTLTFDLTHLRRPRWNAICAVVNGIAALRRRGRSGRAVAPARVRSLLESAGLAPELIDPPGRLFATQSVVLGLAASPIT